VPPAASTPAPVPAAAATLLSEVLSLLPASITLEQAAAILPRAQGLPRDTVRALLEMLVGRERLGVAAAQLAEALDAAVSSGRLPAAVRDRFAALAGRMLAQNAAEFERAIAAARELLRGHRGSVPAARVASEGSLLDELLTLREQVTSRSGKGSHLDTVLKGIDALIERVDTARTQNVRGFEMPYQFMEIPLARQTGFDRAQVHFFGDESSRATGEARAHSVVLDLELSQLGPVWIALHAAGNTCACVMRVASDTARRTLSDASPALEDALRNAGYAGATVRTEAWDGDRTSALVSMSARFAGFEARA
jgi:hypothetical protein